MAWKADVQIYIKHDTPQKKIRISLGEKKEIRRFVTVLAQTARHIIYQGCAGSCQEVSAFFQNAHYVTLNQQGWFAISKPS